MLPLGLLALGAATPMRTAALVADGELLATKKAPPPAKTKTPPLPAPLPQKQYSLPSVPCITYIKTTNSLDLAQAKVRCAPVITRASTPPRPPLVASAHAPTSHFSVSAAGARGGGAVGQPGHDRIERRGSDR